MFHWKNEVSNTVYVFLIFATEIPFLKGKIICGRIRLTHRETNIYLSSIFGDFCLSVEWVEPRLQLTPHLWDLQNSTATDLVPGKVVYFVLFCVFTIHFLCVSPLFFAKLNRHRSSARYNCLFYILLCLFILHFLCGFPLFL